MAAAPTEIREAPPPETNTSVITQHLQEVSGSRLRRTLYIGGLDDFLVTKDTLKKAFLPFGDIRNCEIPFNRNTNKQRGFGFVEFEDDADAKQAIENMDGSELCGRIITVTLAKKIRSGDQRIEQLNEIPEWAAQLLADRTALKT